MWLLPHQWKTRRANLSLLVATMLDMRSANLMELAKDHEVLPEISEAMVTIAMIRLMLHRLAHPSRRLLPVPWLLKQPLNGEYANPSMLITNQIYNFQLLDPGPELDQLETDGIELGGAPARALGQLLLAMNGIKGIVEVKDDPARHRGTGGAILLDQRTPER